MAVDHKHHAHKRIIHRQELLPPEARAQERAAGLPDQGTDEGALARLFLAEVSVPDTDDMKEARREMDLMHCVLINRLSYPKDFDAGHHASTITQIISAHEGHPQFQGFEHYPIFDKPQQSLINDLLKISLNGKDSRNDIYRNFVKTAVDAANDPSPIDPTATGL